MKGDRPVWIGTVGLVISNMDATNTLVDDEAPVRRLIKTILVRQGFQVIEAKDGLTAFLTLQKLNGDLSLIVSDVRMPRMDGVAFCKKAKKEFPRIPVLLISGNEPDASIVADRFLPKPLHLRHHCSEFSRNTRSLKSLSELPWSASIRREIAANQRQHWLNGKHRFGSRCSLSGSAFFTAAISAL